MEWYLSKVILSEIPWWCHKWWHKITSGGATEAPHGEENFYLIQWFAFLMRKHCLFMIRRCCIHFGTKWLSDSHRVGFGKLESSPITSASLIMPKPLTLQITIKCGKFFKRWECQTILSASWEICMQVKKQQLEPEWINKLVPYWERSTSRLYIVTLLI